MVTTTESDFDREFIVVIAECTVCSSSAFMRNIISIDFVICMVDERQVLVMLRIDGLLAIENIWLTYCSVTLPSLSRTECYVSSHTTSAIFKFIQVKQAACGSFVVYHSFHTAALIHIINVQCRWMCIRYGRSFACPTHLRHHDHDRAKTKCYCVALCTNRDGGREVLNFSLTPPQTCP